MEALKILFTAMVDGITGFLPISSSGHLAVLKNIFDIGAMDSTLFDIWLKLAALVVIVLAMRKDVFGIIKAIPRTFKLLLADAVLAIQNIGAKEKRAYYGACNTTYGKLLVMLIVTSIPTAFMGLALRDLANYLCRVTLVLGICIIITGVVLFLIERDKVGDITPKTATFFSAFIIGVVQGIAIIPGLSRCGLVITACILLRYNKKFAFKYTFLTAVPAIIGAVLVDIIDLIAHGCPDINNIGWYILGMILASVTGYVGIRLMNNAVKRSRYRAFSIYCLVAGATAIGLFVVL